jgi:hypothetical protein
MYENDELQRLSAGYVKCKAVNGWEKHLTERLLAILAGVWSVLPANRKLLL